MAQEQDLLTQLSQATDLRSAKRIVRELERHFLYTWRPVGDNEANYGLINIGSDPGTALVERITNALDGVIEREALRQLDEDELAVTAIRCVLLENGVGGSAGAGEGVEDYAIHRHTIIDYSLNH